jgi:uncharacterized membrane protein YgcG
MKSIVMHFPSLPAATPFRLFSKNSLQGSNIRVIYLFSPIKQPTNQPTNQPTMVSLPMRSSFALLLVVQATVQAVVLIPSSQYRMALRPTFNAFDMESMHALQKSMESVLMQVATTDNSPRELNVVIQSHKLGNAASTSIALDDLPTTLVTFAVLGTFADYQPEATGTTVMNNVVSKAFTRATYKGAFLASLKATQDLALMRVIDVSIELLNKESELSNPIVEEEEAPSAEEELTVVDISLIAVSSLICIGIVMVVIQSSREEKTKKPPRSASSRTGCKYPSPAVQHKLTVPSFDESMTSTPHLQFLPESTNSDSPPEQALDSHFRILHHSPPKTPGTLLGSEVDDDDDDDEGSLFFEQHETSIMSMSSMPSSVASGDSPPGAVPSSGGSSSSGSSGGSSGRSSVISGALPASLGSLSGHFSSSKWFEDGASQTSFSVDSQDVFGVDVESGVDCCKPSDSKSCSSKTIDSAHGITSLIEWARTIRVINSDNNSLSVATLHSAPELEHYFNSDSRSVDGDCDYSSGFATI